MGGTVFAESGLQFTEALDSRSGTYTVVFCDGDRGLGSSLGVGVFHCERVDFGIKVALLLCRLGFLIRRCREFVLLSTGDVVLLGHILGRNSF